MEQAAADQKQQCGAKTRPGAKHPTCTRAPMPGKKRCRRHGGLTPSGPDSPHWKHGRDAKTPVPTLEEQYDTALADPLLMQYRHDVALLEALRRNITVRQRPDRMLSAAVEQRLLNISDTIRKVKEAEHRRLQQLQLMVPLEQHRRAMTTAAHIVVTVLARATEDLRQQLAAGGVDQALIDQVNPLAWQQEMQHEMRIASARTPAIVVITAGVE